VKAPRAPRLEKRRAAEFSAELQERARAWLPAWSLADEEHDFGRALLEIAARFSSEVAQRLDIAGEKMRRGFLDWLAERGDAARPARMPVVFKLTDAAREGVLASAPVRMQADAGGTPVVFETEKDVRIVPGQLAVVVGVDADADAFYLPPPGLSDLNPLEPLPTQWQVKSFAAAGAINFQLDPEAGLLPDTIIEAEGEQYRIVSADKDLIMIDPPLVAALPKDTLVTKVTTFSPFDQKTRNQQQHALYLGDAELLNVEAAATIEVVGASTLREGFTWQYWGKVDGKDEVAWQPLAFDDEKQKTVSDAIVLTKPKGAIEETEIGGKKSRWIRAFEKTVEASADPFTADDFSVRVNSSACGNQLTDCPPVIPVESPKAEAMANTTPLVLDNIFLPLGREPRQFDAFYLGSNEAFSKKGAQVRLCFELADPTFTSLAVLRGGTNRDRVIAGVGRDRALHLFQFRVAQKVATVSSFRGRDALRPPLPGDSGAVPTQTKPRFLNPKCRPVISNTGNDFFVKVAGGGSIWTWHENDTDAKLSGWKEFDPLPEAPDAPTRIDDIVPVNKANVSQVVLSNCHLWIHDGTEWSDIKTENQTTSQPVRLCALVPILDANLAPGADMVGVSSDNRLQRVATDGKCTPLPLVFNVNNEHLVDAGVAPTGSTCKLDAIRPVAFSAGVGRLAVVTANDARDKLVCYREDPILPNPEVLSVDLPAGDQVIGSTVDLSFLDLGPQFSVLCKTAADATYIASWQPFGPEPFVKEILFRSNLSNLGSLNGAPVTLFDYIVAPGSRGDLLIAPFLSSERRLLTAQAEQHGVILPDTNNPFAAGDFFSVIDAIGVRVSREIAPDGVLKPAPDATEVLYPVTTAFPGLAADPSLLGFRITTSTLVGVAQANADELGLDGADTTTTSGTFLVIKDGSDIDLYEVDHVNPGTPRVAVLTSSMPNNTPSTYAIPEPSVSRIAAIIRLNAVEGNWPASLLEQARLYFPTAIPPEQRAKAFKLNVDRPEVIALQILWNTPPAVGDRYVIDATLGAWQHVLADTSSNPELSWEYSNGTAWGSLILEEEGTLNLKNTGAVRFKVPDDIAAVDWAGKTNHWIRARLIGGDYGREELTVTQEETAPKVIKQKVERSTEGIRPPSVVELHITYGYCKGVRPSFVLAEDSGTVRDQSDANRTPGAIVEAFVPLALTLGRLGKSVAAKESDKPKELCFPVDDPETVVPEPPKAEDCPECDCQTLHLKKAELAQAVAKTSNARITGRELYIGLAATLSEAPVNVLLLVNEQPHTKYAPMLIEALSADRFVPIVADDATRALGESGVLSMTFAVQPTRSELFGKKNLTWLRLIPKEADEDWLPTLRGAYLNAAWASAKETLTRELLGSSDGAPNLTVTLARPPALRHTLELRVREPLGDEERIELLRQDPNSVLSAVDGLDGDWVLWKQVIDPDDEPDTERVYALDETKGEIRFGDGQHGRIPPVGRDSIVAFTYARTEPDPTGGDRVPGNTIESRTPLNLVSPVETVESVTAADQAAGGAPPESDDRVLRYGYARVRHRDRAVTAQDLEDLALESSPDIVQARAFVRRGYIRLVVVMRGKDPVPTAAQIRELRRLLLDAAPVSLSAPNALRIEGPRIRRLRVELELLVETLDRAGEVSAAVKQKLLEFFDTGTGGIDEDGWQLGAKPSEEDIAFAISDSPHLEAIGSVKLHEITADGTELPALEGGSPREIVMLADDPIRIQFETAEVMA
jgi:hypothetical protein